MRGCRRVSARTRRWTSSPGSHGIRRRHSEDFFFDIRSECSPEMCLEEGSGSRRRDAMPNGTTTPAPRFDVGSSAWGEPFSPPSNHSGQVSIIVSQCTPTLFDRAAAVFTILTLQHPSIRRTCEPLDSLPGCPRRHLAPSTTAKRRNQVRHDLNTCGARCRLPACKLTPSDKRGPAAPPRLDLADWSRCLLSHNVR